MSELFEINQKLNYYVKLAESPVAVKMLTSFDAQYKKEYPNCKVPHIDMGIKVVLCQAMSIARKYNWELILTKDDISCPTGLVTLGFYEMIDSMLTGKDKLAPYNQCEEARSNRMNNLCKLAYRQFEAVMLAPIQKAQFDPDLIVIYGNSAQIMRMVQGAVFEDGGSISASSAGGQGCSQYLTYPLLSNQCRFVLPGNGDRIFGLAGNDQMIFSMPKSKIDITIKGLEESHKGGQRYPVPSYLRYEAAMPNSYNELTKKLAANNAV